MHLLWDPRTLLILIQPTPSSSVSLPITPRPPSSLGIRINTTTLSLSLLPSQTPFAKIALGRQQ